MKFWDTSALLPLVIHEATSAAMISFFDQNEPVCIWTLTPIEAASALQRLYREKRLAAKELETAMAHFDQIFKGCLVIKNVERVKSRALRLLRLHSLKSADALQLAAALVSSQEEPQNHHFVTLDKRLKEAAHLEGFLVLMPD